MNRPTLGRITVSDVHTRTVVIPVIGAEPMDVLSRIRGVVVRFQPSTLRIHWAGLPPQLVAVHLSGPRLTGSGKVDRRGFIGERSYLDFDASWFDDDTGKPQITKTDFRLSADTPDWVRDLVAKYTPTWEEPEWNDDRPPDMTADQLNEAADLLERHGWMGKRPTPPRDAR